MLDQMLENVRTHAPLIHNITNYVTVNDCANILLACGGSPIIADEASEAEEITAICAGLNINMGTLNAGTIAAMSTAGKHSNRLGHPVLLDPVGVGASRLRNETAAKFLNEIRFAAIRGNSSEIKTLVYGSGTTKGVDADIADAVTDENLDQAAAYAKAFSAKTGAIIAITGAIDVVADSQRAFCIRNGHPMMSRITGTGCMLSAMMTAYLAANSQTSLEAAAAAVASMGVCGEKAHARLTGHDGNSTYRNYIIDEVFHLTGDELKRSARYEMR